MARLTHHWFATLLSSLRGRLRHDAVRDVFYVAIDAGAGRGLLIIAMMLVARSIGSHEFGRLNVINGTVALLIAFIAEAMRVTTAKQVAATLATSRQECGRIVAVLLCGTTLIAIALAALLALNAEWIANTLFAEPDLVVSLRLAAYIVVFESLAGVISGALSGFGQFKGMAFCGIFTGVLLVPTLYLAARSHGVEGVVFALVANATLSAALRAGVLIFTLKRKQVALHLAPRRSDLGLYRRFTLPAILNSLTWAPIQWCVVALLVHSTDGFVQSGYLGIANQWFAALLFLPNVIGNALLPRLAETAARKDMTAFVSALKTAAIVTLAVGLAAALFVLLMSDRILSLYGPEYSLAKAALAAMAFAAAVASVNNLLGYALGAVDKMWTSFTSGVIWAALYLCGAAIAIYLGYGTAGVGVALLIAYAAKLFFQIVVLRRSLSSHEPPLLRPVAVTQ